MTAEPRIERAELLHQRATFGADSGPTRLRRDLGFLPGLAESTASAAVDQWITTARTDLHLP